MTVGRTEEFRRKCMTAQEAARLVKPKDRVYVGIAASFAYVLMDALWERRDELEDVTILCSQSIRDSRMFCTPCGEHNPFRIETCFLGMYEKTAIKNGMSWDYTSFHLSEVDLWSKEIGRADVCFFEVSPMDEDGYFSYGPSGMAMNDELAKHARTIVLEVNQQTPYITGERCLLSLDQADAVIETDQPLSTYPTAEPDDVSRQISEHILAEIPDGATIQLGLGKVSTAIGYGLMQKNDLGIHTELFSESMYQLIKNGNVTNQKKGFLDGRSVFAFSMGSREMYEYMDHNPAVYGGSYHFVNDPRVIAKNKRMISVNSAMSIDLFGQVAAERIGWKQQSGCGGQIDFVRGAQWSEGGKSFIAMQSVREKNGERQSKIVLAFPEGTTVTTARSDVQYVATEYGCVNLKCLNMSDRVRAMIRLAHPDFRDELTEQAKDKHLI